MTRVGVRVAWFGVVVAFAACSGKTTRDVESEEAGSGGGGAGSDDTGGTSSNSEAGSTETPSETGGRPATGGSPSAGGDRATGGRVSTGGTATGGTPQGEAGDGGTTSASGGRSSGAAGQEPNDTGGVASTGGASGTAGATGNLFGCGPVSCVEGKSYCYNYTPGTPTQQARAECKRLPEDCSDCDCLCPPTTPDGQCSGASDDPSASCLCGGETGKLVISCVGS
jgi:hypothetical protein